jgi:hypothetical protein
MCNAIPADATISAQTETMRASINQRIGLRDASPLSAGPVTPVGRLGIRTIAAMPFKFEPFQASVNEKPLLPRIPDRNSGVSGCGK